MDLEKLKCETITLPQHKTHHQQQAYHVSDFLKQALEGFDVSRSNWMLSGSRKSCGLDQIDPEHPVIKQYFEDNPDL